MEDKLYTIDEVAEYLKIPKSTIYKLSQKGKLPSCKIGKQLRFRQSSLNKWLTQKEGRSTSGETIGGSASKSILLVEDDALVQRAIARLLKTHGYAVELAGNGEEALEKIRTTRFDLLITDIRMPGMDGIEMIKRTREECLQNNRPRVSEIVITGYADGEKEREAESLGITEYLYKPFATTDFIETIERKLSSSIVKN